MDKEQLIEELAIKHNLTKKEVKEAINSQAECTAHVMKKGEAETIRWRYFGKFEVHPYRLKKLKENSNGRTLSKSVQ